MFPKEYFCKAAMATHLRRKKSGLCTRCGVAPARKNRTRCLSCNDKHMAHGAERYREYINAKVCPWCREHRPLEVGRKSCSDCLLDRQLQELRKVGLSDSEIERAKLAVKEFNGICQACGRTDCGIWCLDHCHETLRFRGIVGRYCNLALGNAKDNPQTLRLLADYLERISLCWA
jgi:hypothetical protein